MVTEKGQKVAGALNAIVRMHSDTSKLLVDCDKHIGPGRKSIFGSYATRDLTWNARAEYWMAESVFRYYDVGSALVDGVGVTFFATGHEIEPLLKVARIQYQNDATQPCDAWDIWSLYFSYLPEKELGKVLSCGRLEETKIEWARLIAVPLFSINHIEDVIVLMNRVRAESPGRAVEAL